jgi:hypothetical protein
MNQTSQIILRTEREVKTDLKKQRSSNDNGSNPPVIDNFVVRQVDQKWEIEFSKRNMRGDIDTKSTYVIAAKRGGIRKFARLSGVLAWMKRMGIHEFKVMLSE